ncbi:MAG: hypothetical protein ACKPKO_23520 [Candidatus Fonsibacter sp.]
MDNNDMDQKAWWERFKYMIENKHNEAEWSVALSNAVTAWQQHRVKVDAGNNDEEKRVWWNLFKQLVSVEKKGSPQLASGDNNDKPPLESHASARTKRRRMLRDATEKVQKHSVRTGAR